MTRCSVLFLCFAMALVAEPWPQWRGPLGNGISPEAGLPTEWSEDANIAWKVPLAGMGVSSPVVSDGRVYVTYQIGASELRPGNHPSLVQDGDPTASGERPLGGARAEGADDTIVLVVAAHRQSDGAQIWEHRMEAEGTLPQVHEKRNLATPSPVTDGEFVYAWFSSGQLVALNGDGKPVWSRNLAREIAPFDISWGHASSPALYEDKLILLCYHGGTATLLVLDKASGEQVWRVDRERELTSYSTPIVVDGPRGPEMVVNTNAGVEAFDPATGELLWHFEEANRFPVPIPTFDDGIVYMSRGYRSGPYMALRLGGRGDISGSHIIWRSATGAPYVSSVIQYQGLVYMANGGGIFTCVDAKTGERVWQERLGGVYTASPVAGDGKVYFTSESGETVVLRAGRTPDVLSRNTLDEHLMASPAISDGQLFLRGDRHLIAVQKAGR